jgi:uncharacterized protein involved in response to NO
MPISVIEPPVRRQDEPGKSALFALGFRPFFLFAGVFSVLAVGVWLVVYLTGTPLLPARLSAAHWHGHEMVFGYAMAVVAGFLLTAVGNWTGTVTLSGRTLAGLFALWLAARLAFAVPGDPAFAAAAVADLLFGIALLIAITLPVVRARQWPQLGILSKAGLMVLANAVFFAGAFGVLDRGIEWGLGAGLYLLVALVFAMGRRVMPMFIERGVDEAATLRQRAWIDATSLVLFLLWVVLEVFFHLPLWLSALSVVLLAIHGLRLYDWHTPGIWRKPLLWSLYLGYGFVLLGFALKAIAPWQPLAGMLASHAFAYGTVGLVTLGMMARVSLGHTGRNVFEPPAALGVLFAMAVVGALVRVVLPLAWPVHYAVWIGLSQALWLLAFAGFVWVFAPILWRPRIDGRLG